MEKDFLEDNHRIDNYYPIARARILHKKNEVSLDHGI